MHKPKRPVEAEGVWAWEVLAHHYFYAVPAADPPPAWDQTQEGIAFRLLDHGYRMGEVWRELAKEPEEKAEDFIDCAISKGTRAIIAWEPDVAPRIDNQNIRLSRGSVSSRLDELLGRGDDPGLLEGLLEAFEDNSDWSALDIRSSLKQLRDFARALEDDPEARRRQFGASIGETKGSRKQNQPQARYVASHLKAILNRPEAICTTIHAVFEGETGISPEDIRKTPAASNPED